VNETSPAINFSILVGGIFCNQSGYLLDVDDDGIFDWFTDNLTGNMTMVVFKDDDYLLDLDGDGKLDHMVDAKSGLSTYKKEIDVDTPGFEMILLIGTILCLLFFRKKKMR